MAELVLCAIQDCGATVLAKGWCRKHYERNRLHGDPLGSIKRPEARSAIFYRNVVLPYEGDECLTWPYGRSKCGYGRMTRADGKRGLVSRFLCEDVNGPPPTPKHHAAHNCGKGHLGCVTKKHMEWKTAAANAADRIVHDTHNRGERCGTSKLTEANVREIIAARGIEKQADTAKRFGIYQSAVSAIQNGKTWVWLYEQVVTSPPPNPDLRRRRNPEARP